MKSSLLFFLLLISSAFLSAQDYQLISGQLLNKESGAPIPYANIGIPERGIGTTSNEDGQFTFKVPDYYRNSSLIVSVIGYKTFTSPVKEFSGYVIIDLEPTSYRLSEIQIVDENGVENIIRKAVARIPENYPTHPTKVLGFYRESRTDSDDNHVYLAEGVLNIYKDSYKKSDEGMVSLVQGRKMNLKNPLDTIIRAGFTSGHMAAHRFDFVKNREDFIDEDYFPAYKYWIESITTYNGREVYVIGFDKDPNGTGLKKKKIKDRSFIERIFSGSRDDVLDARLKGKVFIEKETYAFIRAEFEITEKGLSRFDDYPLYSGRWTFNKYIVNYQQIEGKWYFSDALREGGRTSGGVYSNEIKITEVETKKAKPIPYLERLSREEEFVELTGAYDEDFWKSYNTVQMSEKLSESIQQFKNATKAEQIFAIDKMQEIQEIRDSLELEKRIAQAQQNAEEKEEPFDPESITFGEPGLQQKRNRSFRMEAMLGAGANLISTVPTSMSVTYFNEDLAGLPLRTSGDINARAFEAIYMGDLNFVFSNRWFLRFSGARDFGRTIFRESASGIGVQFNLSRQRPVFVKLSAQHSSKRYARVVGLAENNEERITIGGKNFNSNEVRIFYGDRTRQLKLSGELTVELNPNKEIYFRGAYYLPYAQRQEVHFREKPYFFRKKVRLDSGSERLLITNNDEPFSGSIFEPGEIQITVGYLFK